MKYQILTADTVVKIEEDVAAALREGWQLLGGISVVEYGTTWTDVRKGGEESQITTLFAQAMIKPTQEEYGIRHEH